MFPPGNFIFVPGPGGRPGRLTELGDPQLGYLNGSFVLIEYSEPRVKKPIPVFYPAIGYREAELPVDTALPPLEFTATVSRHEYLKAVRELKTHIQRGDIYEVNYCVRFSARCVIDPFVLFQRLCQASDAPYRMMARLDARFILCASPELFLKKDGNSLLTKPIKGTAPRGASAEEDARLKNELYNSHKDRTENVMAVDVARNDLSVLAARASVTVDRLFGIESFSTVHQMVSNVRCRLKEEANFHDIIEATFPMASMTGAPKRKAMELASLHEGFDRGLYSGTMGFIDADNNFELPVLIRSLFYEPDKSRLWFATGGAITHLSDPEKEYEECILKAATLLRATEGTIV